MCDVIVAAESATPPRTAACPSPATARVQHLFRTSLRVGQVHPLMHSLLLHRARVPDGTGAEVAVQSTDATPSAPRSLDPEQVRRRVAELPPLPQAALRALQTLRRDDASLDQVAEYIGCDASLTARVLRLANSPFYGASGRVSSVRDAAQILGRRTLESVLTLAAIAGQFDGARCRQFDTKAFWRHAIASAIAARLLARAAGVDENRSFVAALLHDIGLLAMSVYFPDELGALIGRARREDVEIRTIEREHGLTPHALVGSWIAAHWNFPAEVVRAIAGHHDPSQVAGGDDGVAACIHLANAIGHALDLAQLEEELVPMVDTKAWTRVAPDDERLCRLFDETESGVRALCVALAL